MKTLIHTMLANKEVNIRWRSRIFVNDGSSFLCSETMKLHQLLCKHLRHWQRLHTRTTTTKLHCVSKNDTDVTHYSFNPHQPISVIFGRDVAERVCYWMVIYYPTSLYYLGKHEPGNCVFSVRHRHVSSPGECGWLRACGKARGRHFEHLL